jgi:hypothetical protein
MEGLEVVQNISIGWAILKLFCQHVTECFNLPKTFWNVFNSGAADIQCLQTVKILDRPRKFRQPGTRKPQVLKIDQPPNLVWQGRSVHHSLEVNYTQKLAMVDVQADYAACDVLPCFAEVSVERGAGIGTRCLWTLAQQ